MRKRIIIALLMLLLLTAFYACEKEKTPEHVHTPAKSVNENTVESTCTSDGSFDNVIYCTECGEELSRISVPHAAVL